MSVQAAVDFLERVKSDESLAQELVKAMEAENDRVAVAELATTKGYDITPDELWAEVQKRQEERKQRQDAGELSDEELEAVAGGELVLVGILVGVGVAVTFGAAGVSIGITATAPPVKW